MAYRGARLPRTSVVLAAGDDELHLERAVESVLSQKADFELVIADCGTTGRVAALIDRFHERDIRVETVRLEDSSVPRALTAALAVTRGSHILIMGQNDWLAPGMLSELSAFAVDNDLDLAVPARSKDLCLRKGEPPRCRALSLPTECWGPEAPECEGQGLDEAREAVAALYGLGLLEGAFGVLVRRPLALPAAQSFKSLVSPVEYMVRCLRDVRRVGVLDSAPYHSFCGYPPAAMPCELGRFACLEREHASVLSLCRAWGVAPDSTALQAVHYRHVIGCIGCIDNMSIGAGRLTSAERISRIDAMLAAPAVAESLDAVSGAARDFGLMYRPMLGGNAVACAMFCRLRELGRASHVPMAPVL